MGSNSKGGVVLSVEESGSLKVLQQYNFRDLFPSSLLLWPDGGLSRPPVAEPQKCSPSPPVAPRARDDDLTRSLKILFALLLVWTVINNMTTFIIGLWLYHILYHIVLPAICVIVIVVVLTKIATKMKEWKKMREQTLKTINVKTVSVGIQHI